MTSCPLVVDLDGTLILTDVLHEAALRALRERPLALLGLPVWLAGGPARVKQAMAARVPLHPESLPYNLELLEWLRMQKAAGRRLVLCTAADRAGADAVASHLGLFDEVLASDGHSNLAGRHKAEALVGRYGRGGFDYAGNSRRDLPVWQAARQAIVVNASPALAAKAADCCPVERVFPAAAVTATDWRRLFRTHQWLKNLLLFVAPAAAHRLGDTHALALVALGFLAFSLCASSVYIVNDLMDLESDRQHPRKRRRPFAAGVVPVWAGTVLAPLLLLLSVLLARFGGERFLLWMLAYFVLTCAYSFGLKRLVLVDCLTLAMLYTLRIIAGAAAAGLTLSLWLLAFSAFLFLSLSFIKRYAELQLWRGQEQHKAHGRGYYVTDAPLVQVMGVTSGYAAAVVLALYLNSQVVQQLYRSPELVWGAVPIVLFWVSWMWLQAHRGRMHDDPLVFAIFDRVSLLAGAAFALVLTAGALGWPW